jgi:hypothetical protein
MPIWRLWRLHQTKWHARLQKRGRVLLRRSDRGVWTWAARRGLLGRAGLVRFVPCMRLSNVGCGGRRIHQSFAHLGARNAVHGQESLDFATYLEILTKYPNVHVPSVSVTSSSSLSPHHWHVPHTSYQYSSLPDQKLSHCISVDYSQQRPERPVQPAAISLLPCAHPYSSALSHPPCCRCFASMRPI